MNEGPLSDILVVDLTRVLAGPYCTRFLRDLGARVIKVEPPQGGDDARQIGPFTNVTSGSDTSDNAMSAYFLSLNCGKESIMLDLKDEADKVVFEKILARADVLVENFRPGVLARLGFSWEHLHEKFPRLIYAAISGFGATGPYANRPAYDMVVQAMGGIMSITGHEGEDPVRVGMSIGDIATGLFASNAITAALVKRASTDKGCHIDLAMLDCQVAIMENAVARFHATGDVPGRIGARHPSSTPFDAFATADGHIILAASNDVVFKRLCAALGRPELGEQANYSDNHMRTDHQASLKREIELSLAARTTDEWLEIFEQSDVPCGPINTIAELAEDPQIADRNMMVAVEGSEDMKISGNPIKIEGIVDDAARPAAPQLDQDRDAILREFTDS